MRSTQTNNFENMIYGVKSEHKICLGHPCGVEHGKNIT